MGLADWFSIISPEERARREREYRKKVLPFGDWQKEAALSLLKRLLGTKRTDQELFYFFITAKEKVLDEIPLPDIRKYLNQRGKLKDDEIQLLLSLVQLDCSAESPEAYPSIEDIRAFSEQHKL